MSSTNPSKPPTMIHEPTLFSLGEQLRDEGMEAVIAADVAVHRGAGDFIRETIQKCAVSGIEFTAEDVRDALKDNAVVVRELADKPNLLPALMGQASHSGLIEAVGVRKSSRVSRRAGRNLVWVGRKAA